MRLLSSQEVKAHDSELTQKQLKESRQLSEFISTATKTANELRGSIIAEHEKAEKEFQNFQVQAEQKRAELVSEISGLEARRKGLLAPVESLIAELRVDIEQRMSVLEEREQALLKSITDISHREDSVKASEAVLVENKKALADETSRIKKQTEASTKTATEIKALSEKTNRDREEFETKQKTETARLANWETDLTTREQALKISLESLEKGKKLAKEENTRLLDREQQINLAFQELRRKTNGTSQTRR